MIGRSDHLTPVFRGLSDVFLWLMVFLSVTASGPLSGAAPLASLAASCPRASSQAVPSAPCTLHPALPHLPQASLQPLLLGGSLAHCQALHLLLGHLAVPSAVQLTWRPGGCSGPPHCPPAPLWVPCSVPGREGPSLSGVGPALRSCGQLSGM